MTPATVQRIFLLIAVLIFAATSRSSVAQSQTGSRPPTPDADYTAAKSDPIGHEAEFAIVVTPPCDCEVLKVWVPVPQSDAGQQISDSRFSTFPMEVEPRIENENVYGNRFAYFEFHKPQGAQIIRHDFKARVWNLTWGLDDKQVDEVAEWPESFAPWLQPQPVDDALRFREVLNELVPEPQGVKPDLASVMQWIDANMTYDHVNASLQADANHAFETRRGHCSDYHGLCATMGKALGYPAQVTYGLALYPKNSPSHCKIEAYFPPHGWVSFDLSETQKLIQSIDADESLDEEDKARLTAAARHRLHSGFRENSWLLLTRGTDYELAPKASKPVRVVRTAYIEADGVPLPEPDPANAEQLKFAWMTAHRYRADKPFTLPFKDWSSLTPETER